MNKNIKILFLHNCITWYRIPLFIELNKKLNIKFLFTNQNIKQKEYKNINVCNSFMKDLDYKIIENQHELFHYVYKYDYDVILISVLDTFKDKIEGILNLIFAKIRRKKIVYFWEYWEIPDDRISSFKLFKRKLKKLFLKIFFKNIDAFVSPGLKTKEFFINCGINENKIFVANDSSYISLSNKIKFINIREKYNIPYDKKIILYFGRIIERKGLDYLIKAFKKLENERKDVFLLICGDGDFSQQCKNIAHNLNIQNIYFTGIIQPEFRSFYYSQCDIFVLPSRFYNGYNEPWGLSINEAMEFGKPIVTTNAVGAAYDLVKNDYNGYMVDEGDIYKLYKALKEIIINDKLRNVMGKNSNKIIEKNYKYSDMSKGFINAFLFDSNNKIVERKPK